MFQNASFAEEITLSTALERYKETILQHKKGKDTEAYRLKHLDRDLGYLKLAQMQPYVVSQYRDKGNPPIFSRHQK